MRTAAGESLRAYAELSRLSNSPTVLSNVLVGCAIGLASAQVPAGAAMPAIPWGTVAITTVAVVLFYIGGMALNDLVDADVDARERPGRPIPSGRVSRRAALVFVLVCFTMGLGVTALLGGPALGIAAALVSSIVLYDLLHKKAPAAVIFMGLCRGLVYLLAAAAVAWPLHGAVALPPAIAITVYIILVTLIARGEATGRVGMSRHLSITLIFIALSPVVFIVPSQWPAAIVAGLIMLGWLAFNQRHLLIAKPAMKQAVMGYLAGIALFDAYVLMLFDQPVAAGIAGLCFIATCLWQRRIAGT